MLSLIVFCREKGFCLVKMYMKFLFAPEIYFPVASKFPKITISKEYEKKKLYFPSKPMSEHVVQG